MKINIYNYRLYSPSELRSYAEKGLLNFDADSYTISQAVLYMLEGMYTYSELETAKEEAYDEGFKDNSEMSYYDKDEIKRAIGILEDLI